MRDVRLVVLRGFFLSRYLRATATVPSTAAPVAATASAAGPPPTSAAAATRDVPVLVPVTASGTTGHPPGVCSTAGVVGAGGCSGSAGVGGGMSGVASGATTGVIVVSVMLCALPCGVGGPGRICPGVGRALRLCAART